MNMELHAAMTKNHERLSAQLFAKQAELNRRELSQGKSHDVRKLVRLRDEIEAIEARLRRCELVLEHPERF